jgi:hypothetical protein
MKMLAEDDIRIELGWTGSTIHSLLRTLDSNNARRDKLTGGYAYGLYHRDRVLAVAQSKDGQAPKRRWVETLGGNAPNTGWRTRLGDIGRALAITAIAVGSSWSYLGTAAVNMSPTVLSRLDAALDGGTVTLFAMSSDLAAIMLP